MLYLQGSDLVFTSARFASSRTACLEIRQARSPGLLAALASLIHDCKSPKLRVCTQRQHCFQLMSSSSNNTIHTTCKIRVESKCTTLISHNIWCRCNWRNKVLQTKITIQFRNKHAILQMIKCKEVFLLKYLESTKDSNFKRLSSLIFECLHIGKRC